MKKFYLSRFFALMGVMLFAAFTLASCEEDEEKHYTINFSVNYSGGNGFNFTNEQTLQLGVTLNSGESSEGIVIENVEYYIDNTYIGSSSISPFTMRYPCTDLSIGTHVLRVNLTWTVEGFRFTSEKESQFYIVEAGQGTTTTGTAVTFSAAE